MKVVIACDTFAPDINGAARFAERLAAGLVRHGHEVHIIAPSYDESAGMRIENHDGSKMFVHRMRSHRMPQHKSLRWPEPWGLTGNIRKVLKDVQPQALHIQSHLIMGRFAVRAARGTGVKLIATNHIMPENLVKYSLLPKFLHPLAMRITWADAGRILKKMDALTTPTRRAAQLLERAAGVSNVLAISCGIDASRFANETPVDNTSNQRFLFLGRLDDEKRIHILLEAVAMLTEHPNVLVELVGDGGERENLQRLAKSLGIADRVIFTGHISDAELPKAYERATAFVMPSIAELQSIATMEAMASGRPVIGANAMALPHLVHDGDNGYLFEPDDPADLASKLRLILEADSEELQRLSDNSLHLIQSHDIEKTLRIFEGLYLGTSDDEKTTDDNSEGYLLPIGRLNDAVSERLRQLRHSAVELRQRAEEIGLEAREKIAEVREDVIEQLEELKDEVKEQISEAAKRLRKKRD
ncbi:glycosyltransferase [Aquiluna borgnonia]|uniref:D-inositol 3-phosphate glycosyltransferase n=1 Tax=Aquiluna borgnonia TaxID=2499157 RepID=A0A7D4UDA3_9MICO|nr:glycosyltransferase [Aquiluna borgnonia]QKJ25194.1 glycosyltransferase [Aquiluna borgnonia]